jgi:hypothetical protein
MLKFVLFCVMFLVELVQVVLFSISEAPQFMRRSGYNSLEKVRQVKIELYNTF